MLIAVQGSHRVQVRPERATLFFMVMTEAGSRDRALAEATRSANALAAQLGELAGVESHSVSPVRVNTWRPSDQNGRRLAERVTAQVDLTAVFADFDALAAFTARAGSTAGVQLGGVTWSITDETRDRIEAEVLTAAIARARRRALVMARAEGASEVEVVDIADPGLLGDGEPRFEVAAAYGARSLKSDEGDEGDEGGGVDVVPEDVEVSETVHVRFQVVEKQARPRRGQA